MKDRIQINGIWYIREDQVQESIELDPTEFEGIVVENDCFCFEETAEEFYPINSSGGSMEMLNRHQLYNSYKQEGFIKGAKWQQERMYSEEDLRKAFRHSRQALIFEKDMPPVYESFEEWFEQFKKK